MTLFYYPTDKLSYYYGWPRLPASRAIELHTLEISLTISPLPLSIFLSTSPGVKK